MKSYMFSILGVILVLSVSVLADEPPEEQWLARYNNLDNNTLNYSWAIAVDNSGDVYVTGISYNSGTTSSDYATIKYDPSGNQLWAKHYHGSGNSYDGARALAIDNSSNVYVTGLSYGSSTGGDYATIKYAPDGNQLWVNRYNGPPGNNEDVAQALALDNSGNVYVTGYSVGGGTGYDPKFLDYATVKYDGLNGNQLWAKRYDGPGNGLDAGRALAIDNNSGNVYVTGSSTGSGTNHDYATVKYDPNGNELWVERYNGPADGNDQAYALSIDGSGNIYVTGRSRGDGTSDDDYATVKYSPDGTEVWVRRYNGHGDNNDWATALIVDNSGNVYVSGVTGYSDGGSIKYDYATIKYDPNGNQLWVADCNGPAHYLSPLTLAALAIDDSYNVYLAGNHSDAGWAYDWVTVKYDSNGNQLWETSYNSPANRSDEIYDLAIDNSGNVYVTGWSSTSNKTCDYLTIKYTQHDYCISPFPADYDGDCKVNFTDFAMLAEDWLQNTYIEDLAELAEDWLECNFALEDDCL